MDALTRVAGDGAGRCRVTSERGAPLAAIVEDTRRGGGGRASERHGAARTGRTRHGGGRTHRRNIRSAT